MNKFTDEELAAVLTGLRLVQLWTQDKVLVLVETEQEDSLKDIFCMGGDVEALPNAEIDRLCERLNSEHGTAL